MELNIGDIIKSFKLELLSIKAVKENEMRKQKKFCDLTLKINDKDLFKVHKNIIASSCSYFFVMLNGAWKESKEISLNYLISPECFEIILDFMYTGKLSITKISLINAKIIHQGSVFFILPLLKEIMSKILQNFITNENVLEMWRHGVKNVDVSLNKMCIKHISTNYIQFFNKNLLELTFTELNKLLQNIYLNCEQDVIYENLIKWIKSDFELRENHLKDLLKFVDFSKLSGEFLQLKVINDKSLYKNENFIEKIMQEFSNSNNIKLRTIVDVPRNMAAKLYIFLISNTGIFKIDLEMKKCIPLLRHKIKRENFAVGKFGFNILISGGLGSNICEIYCPDLNLIREFPPMLQKRRNHKIVAHALDNKIYAFGGYKNDTMEIFDINSGKWSYGPKMPRKLWDFYLYKRGGIIYLQSLNSLNENDNLVVDMFNIKQAKWCSRNMDDIGIKSEFPKSNYLFTSSYYLVTNKNNYNILDGPLFYFTDRNKLCSFDFTNTEDDNVFIFGNISNSDKFLSALLDEKTGILTHIKIDFSMCDDIGHYFRLTTAYL